MPGFHCQANKYKHRQTKLVLPNVSLMSDHVYFIAEEIAPGEKGAIRVFSTCRLVDDLSLLVTSEELGRLNADCSAQPRVDRDAQGFRGVEAPF